MSKSTRVSTEILPPHHVISRHPYDGADGGDDAHHPHFTHSTIIITALSNPPRTTSAPFYWSIRSRDVLTELGWSGVYIRAFSQGGLFFLSSHTLGGWVRGGLKICVRRSMEGEREGGSKHLGVKLMGGEEGEREGRKTENNSHYGVVGGEGGRGIKISKKWNTWSGSGRREQK